MPLPTWEQITAHPNFQKLTPDQQNRYLNRYVRQRMDEAGTDPKKRPYMQEKIVTNLGGTPEYSLWERMSGYLYRGIGGANELAANAISTATMDFVSGQRNPVSQHIMDLSAGAREHPLAKSQPKSIPEYVAATVIGMAPELPLYMLGEGLVMKTLTALSPATAAMLTEAVAGTRVAKFAKEMVQTSGRGLLTGTAIGAVGAPPEASLVERMQQASTSGLEWSVANPLIHAAGKAAGYAVKEPVKFALSKYRQKFGFQFPPGALKEVAVSGLSPTGFPSAREAQAVIDSGIPADGVKLNTADHAVNRVGDRYFVTQRKFFGPRGYVGTAGLILDKPVAQVPTEAPVEKVHPSRSALAQADFVGVGYKNVGAARAALNSEEYKALADYYDVLKGEDGLFYIFPKRLDVLYGKMEKLGRRLEYPIPEDIAKKIETTEFDSPDAADLYAPWIDNYKLVKTKESTWRAAKKPEPKVPKLTRGQWNNLLPPEEVERRAAEALVPKKRTVAGAEPTTTKYPTFAEANKNPGDWVDLVDRTTGKVHRGKIESLTRQNTLLKLVGRGGVDARKMLVLNAGDTPKPTYDPDTLAIAYSSAKRAERFRAALEANDPSLRPADVGKRLELKMEEELNLPPGSPRIVEQDPTVPALPVEGLTGGKHEDLSLEALTKGGTEVPVVSTGLPPEKVRPLTDMVKATPDLERRFNIVKLFNLMDGIIHWTDMAFLMWQQHPLRTFAREVWGERWLKALKANYLAAHKVRDKLLLADPEVLDVTKTPASALLYDIRAAMEMWQTAFDAYMAPIYNKVKYNINIDTLSAASREANIWEEMIKFAKDTGKGMAKADEVDYDIGMLHNLATSPWWKARSFPQLRPVIDSALRDVIYAGDRIRATLFAGDTSDIIEVDILGKSKFFVARGLYTTKTLLGSERGAVGKILFESSQSGIAPNELAVTSAHGKKVWDSIKEVRDTLDWCFAKYLRDLKDIGPASKNPTAIAEYEATVKATEEIADQLIGNYFPFVRKNKWEFSIFEKGVDQSKADPVWSGGYNRSYQGRTLRAALRQAFPADRYDFTAASKALKRTTLGDLQPTAVMSVFRKAINDLKGTKILPDMPQESMDTLLNEIQDRLMGSLTKELRSGSWASHLMKRKKIPGYQTTDWERILQDYIHGFSAYTSKRSGAIEMAKAISLIDRNSPKLREEAVSFAAELMRPVNGIDKFSGKVRAALFIRHLGFKAAFYFLNSQQNITMGMARLHAEFGEGSAMEFGKASKDLLHLWAYEQISKRPELADRLPAAFRERPKNITDVDMARMVWARHAGFTREIFAKELTGSLDSGWSETIPRKAMDLMSFFASISERQNRESLFLTAARQLEKRGYDETTLRNLAASIVHDSHIVFGKVNLPTLLRGPGAVLRPLYTFRYHQHNYIQFLAWLGFGGGKNGMVAAAKSLAYLGLMTGLPLSIPFYSIAREIVKNHTGKDIEILVRSEIEKATGSEKWADIYSFGLPAASAFIGIPAVSFRTSSEVIGVPQSALDVGGAFVSTLVELGKTARDAYKYRDYWATTAKLLPFATGRPAGDAWKAYMDAKVGMMTSSGRVMRYPLLSGEKAMEPIRLNRREATLEGFGFVPAAKDKARWIYGAMDASRDQIEGMRTNLLDALKYATSLQEGGRTETAKKIFERTITAIFEYNLRHKEFKITDESIVNAVGPGAVSVVDILYQLKAGTARDKEGKPIELYPK